MLNASSGAASHSAWASFRRDVRSNCWLTRTGEGCALTRCESAEPGGESVAPASVTIQGNSTVVLEADNEFSVEGDGSLFENGEEVLFDVAPSSDVPAFRGSLRAPSGTSLAAPLPAEEGAPLELVAGEDLAVEWTPGNNGLMKFYASAGLVGLSCEWTISDGEALLYAETLAELPASDGTDSLVRFWTEQNDVGREGDWEFLLLLGGEAAGATFSGYSRE